MEGKREKLKDQESLVMFSYGGELVIGRLGKWTSGGSGRMEEVVMPWRDGWGWLDARVWLASIFRKRHN